MFLDRELEKIRDAKDRVAMRCELRRSMLQLDMQAMKTWMLGTVSALETGMAVAGLVKDILSSRKDRGR